MVNLIYCAGQKTLEKIRLSRLKRLRKIAIERLEELEKMVDGPFNRESSQRLDMVNEWTRTDDI